MIDLSDENNVVWDILMNASDMVDVDGLGYSIPADKIYVNSSCGDGTGLTVLTPLSHDLQYICTDIPYNQWANVSFWLEVPPGQYNSTYYGNITIFVNSTEAQIEPFNKTWFGPDNTTVMIERFIEISWSGTPIDFETVGPGMTSNATNNHGWPSNITSSTVTNIFIELYLNGTDFMNVSSVAPWNPDFCSDSTCKFESQNTTYSNATVEVEWPDSLLGLSESFYWPPVGYRGDFPNWGCNSTLCAGANLTFPNATSPDGIKNIWWNVSIPPGMPAGNYSATVWAKAVDIGEQP
jgi:hypothetical protein